MTSHFFLKRKAFWHSIRFKMLFLCSIIIVSLFGILAFFSFYLSNLQGSFSAVVDDGTKTQALEAAFQHEVALVDEYVRSPSFIDSTIFFDAQQQTQKLLSSLEPNVHNIHTLTLIHSITIALEQYQIRSTNLVLQIKGNGGVVDDELLHIYTELKARSNYINNYIASLLRNQISLSTETYRVTEHRLIRLHQTLTVVACIFFLIMAFVIYFALSGFVAPITELSHAADQIVHDHFDISDVPVANMDEIGELTHVFNRMRQHIHDTILALEEQGKLKQQLYDQELRNLEMQHELQSAQFKYLQSQINPHFLFNSLNAISIYAQKESAQITVDLILRLSKIFRYYISQPDESIVPLSSEISLLQDYLTLQNVRFQGEISWNIDIDPATQSVAIPKLLLQPIVENSIVHGFRHTGKGNVSISVKALADQRIKIQIDDNGCGFDTNSIAPAKRGSLGLKNIQNRLTLFDPSNRFVITSDPQTGTSIYIELLAQEI